MDGKLFRCSGTRLPMSVSICLLMMSWQAAMMMLNYRILSIAFLLQLKTGVYV